MSAITFKTLRNQYQYEAHPIKGTNWNSVGGNYIFSYQTQTGWPALYVGQTSDFKARFANHEKLQAAIGRGATHILARVNHSESARKQEEADLIATFKPVLNDLLK